MKKNNEVIKFGFPTSFRNIDLICLKMIFFSENEGLEEQLAVLTFLNIL